jgi:hypothetical protein
VNIENEAMGSKVRIQIFSEVAGLKNILSNE